ncbi:hypothetical protein EDF52_113136 [Curtobacterium sp. PhB42]|uniref:hypothetical protein n=1 Tax=unclassified Curtobacterium TaxID=257496 RepID=UPI001050424E|nr:MULTISPECIES: hypothetical protein [unclassified Curtobacterium]TCU82290.1 hypothetical protein EDF48_11242 [Curtobacterium sp. PhB191]TDW43182.1 hypothetical protein EDF52_113136 [Curtobacterium sp. PhB42]TDW53521.1 hypothetical protein EDF47_10933 [Curtobacterium sp. PhB190]
MTRPSVAIATAVVIAAALTGCASTDSDATSSQPQVSVPGAAPSATATADAEQPKITGPGQVTASAQPTAPADAEDAITPAQEGAATGAASGFVSAYVDKRVTGDAWAKGWMPYLTTQAQAAYEGTSQQAVPGTTLSGTVQLEDGGTNGAAIVDVPTDAGTYTVQLNQVNGSWKVLRAILPGEDG